MHKTKDAKMSPIYDQFKEFFSLPEDREYLKTFAEMTVMFDREATKEEIDDILGFFHFCKMQEVRPGEICSTIGHDMGGIANKPPFFVPRTKGYAKHLPS